MSDQLLETYIRQLLETPLRRGQRRMAGRRADPHGTRFLQALHRICGESTGSLVSASCTQCRPTESSLTMNGALSSRSTTFSSVSASTDPERCTTPTASTRVAREFRSGHARLGNAAPARSGRQYPLHDSRRQRRSSAGSLPLLSRSVAGCYMQFIPIVERTTEEFLPLANLGWGERPGADRPLYTQHGSARHRTLCWRRTVRPFSDRHLR